MDTTSTDTAGATMTCAWTDNGAMVVVSLASPGSQSSGVIAYIGAPITEQELATMTLSLRDAAEVRTQHGHIT